MPKAIRICKVCGKQYEACRTPNNGDLFRWQDVACCPEHGSQYFAAVLAAREKESNRSGTENPENPKDE